ncbi:hypothetical protein N7507_007856 [Penicillium longicatenatum]|nr:hypothetical protein N7507_007856 [Penicillium longicatenatum]
MKICRIAFSVFLAVVAATASSGSIDSQDDAKSYAPYYVDCPPDIQLVRQPRQISQAESEWVHGRKAIVTDSLVAYLARLNLADFNLTDYAQRIRRDSNYNVPVIAWATSGGGWRSAYTGIGGLQAIDERTPGSKEAKVGGLFQSLTYMAGLSGGSWPTASTSFSDYAPIHEHVKEWHVDINRFDASNFTEYAAPVTAYLDTIAQKVEAGFNVSTADFLGRGFAYQFVPGVNLTWSSISEQPRFKNFSGPMPMLICSSINKSSDVLNGIYSPSESSPWFEWNPFEFGSWDFGFVPMEYIGTIPNENNTAKKCVKNLDQASFVMGSAASAWNSWWLGATTNGTLGQFSKRHDLDNRESDSSLTGISSLSFLNDYFNETYGYTIAQISNPSIPNPFNSEENITFADGSEAGQSVPFLPLIQPERKVDFIMAWDDDADSLPYTWNNGTNIWDTYNRAKESGLPFPVIPPVSELLAHNYTLKPVLFGCDTNLTTTRDATSPIVAYFANSPYSWYSNYSWATGNMSHTEFDSILENSFNLLTQANGTLNKSWVDCLGCAAIDRSLQRMDIQRPQICEDCFQEHCWDGRITEGVPEGFVLDPVLALDPSLSYAEWSEIHPNT